MRLIQHSWQYDIWWQYLLIWLLLYLFVEPSVTLHQILHLFLDKLTRRAAFSSPKWSSLLVNLVGDKYDGSVIITHHLIYLFLHVIPKPLLPSGCLHSMNINITLFTAVQFFFFISLPIVNQEVHSNVVLKLFLHSLLLHSFYFIIVPRIVLPCGVYGHLHWPTNNTICHVSDHFTL